jgi:putative glutamine amidotransferase
VVARADDGVVEAIEWTRDDWGMVGVQWHPEELIADANGWDRALFDAFAGVVRARASSGDASALRS